MTFEEILDQAADMLQRRGRVSFQAFKRQFDIDDDYLESLKFELVKVQKVAIEEEGVMLAWIGDRELKATPTRSDSVSQSSHTSTHQRSSAERRQLTVMFIDMVGSTALSQVLDPEDLREVLYEYQDLFDGVVNQHNGVVMQHLGDGIVAYFGYPTAHEDDPRRAILSGLAMLKALNELNKRLSKEKNVDLKVRIGVHTGLVVVGATGGKAHSEMTATGAAPNLAARIESVAEPNSILISEATNNLVSKYFETAPSGAFGLKGFSEPVELYKVIGERERNMLDFKSHESPTALVGREWERAQILERWDFARRSHGQVVLISGEAGIGKSRLVRSLVAEIAADSIPLLTFRCSPFHRNTAFQPIIESLQREIGFDREESHEANLNKLNSYIKDKGLNESHDLALCAALLSIPNQELNMSAERRKTLTIAMLVRWLLGSNTPSLVVIEDLHWADPSTLELLGQTINQIGAVPVLFIAAFRPQFQPTWEIGSHVIQIIVNRLNRAQAEAMIHQITINLPDEVVQELLTKTDGNPLFIEEVTKLVLDSGVLENEKVVNHPASALKALSIPNTLQDSLMARLDRLGAAKEVAQIGATIGREFTYSLVKAISHLTEDTLNEHLKNLVTAQLLFAKGEIPNTEFTFKHALIQEAAYSSLLKKQRQKFHRRIVENLEQTFPDVVESNPELLAHHCSQAGLLEQAVPYWRGAGELAISRSAHAEAINHLKEGLTILKDLPESPEHIYDEILFRIALGVPLTSLRGYGSIEVEKTYARASELCHQAGETWQLVPALYGLWRYYLLRADYREASALSDQILSLSRQSNDPVHLVVAHRASGSTKFYLGELEGAREHLDEIIKSKTSPDHRAGTLLYDVVDAWVTARSYASWTYWLQGYPDRALTLSREAMAMAEKLTHPFSIALSQSFAAWLHQFRGENIQTLKCAQKGLIVAEENGFDFWIGWGKILKGWAKEEKGSAGQLASMKEGLDGWYATGSELGSSYFLFLLGESLLTHGNLQEAWQCLERGKKFVEKTGEKWWEAELFRLEGMLYQAKGEPANKKAEKCFRQALKIAADQKARSLELRAATSLAKLLSDTTQADEGFSILKDVVDWFTEGLELPDMLDAKATLESLPTSRT